MGKRPRARQRTAATIAIAASLWAAVQRLWPFNASPRALRQFETPSLAQYVLSDRYTVGFVRLGVAALAMFAVASLAALLVAGRWMRGLGTTGFSTDDDVGNEMQNLRDDLARTTDERDRYIRLLDGFIPVMVRDTR
jgi:hypothetical protein